jgi:hypothetical protein
LEDVDEPAGQLPQPADGSLARLAEHGLEAREGLLDRVEVRAVWREEAQGCACRFDPLFHCHPFVAREVVHDDDVTRAQHGHEHLRHIGFEPVAVDRSVQHHRSDHARHAQAPDQRGGLAVPVREAHPQPLAFRAATVTAGHIRGGPDLVYEDEAFGFEVDLAIEPVLALPQDVGTVLLDRVPGLFLRVIP